MLDIGYNPWIGQPVSSSSDDFSTDASSRYQDYARSDQLVEQTD